MIHSTPATSANQTYQLHATDGTTYASSTPGELGGYSPLRIYGRLDCWSAINHLAKGDYVKHRVFFADEHTAIACGFRPCAKCLGEKYKEWKKGGVFDSVDYPWLVGPTVHPKQTEA